MSNHTSSNTTLVATFTSTEDLKSSFVLTVIAITTAFLPSYGPSITETLSAGWVPFLLALLSGYCTPGSSLAVSRRVLHGSEARQPGMQQSGLHKVNIYPRPWSFYAVATVATATLATTILAISLMMLILLGARTDVPASSSGAYIHLLWYFVKVVADIFEYAFWRSLCQLPSRSNKPYLEIAMMVTEMFNTAISVFGIWIFGTTTLPSIKRAALITFGFVASRQITHSILFFMQSFPQHINLEQTESIYSLTPTRSQHGLPPLSGLCSLTPTRSEQALRPLSEYSTTPTRSQHGLPPLVSSGGSSIA